MDDMSQTLRVGIPLTQPDMTVVAHCAAAADPAFSHDMAVPAGTAHA